MRPSDKVIEDVFSLYQNLEIGFESQSYWNTLRLTYERTVRDIMEVADSHFLGRRLQILEIGAFCGIVSTALATMKDRFEVTAWDLPLFMNDAALVDHYDRMGIHRVEGDLAQLPLGFSEESFDVIICCEVIEHLNFNPLPVFCEFNRILKAEGLLYIGTPNHANIYKRWLLARGQSIHNPIKHLIWQLNPSSTFSIGLHWREYTTMELIQLTKLTGFRLLKAYYCHLNENRNPSLIRYLLVQFMYMCFPSFLPSQVVIGIKESLCHIKHLDQELLKE